MSTHDVQRRTEKVDEALNEVLVGSDTALATVTRAVRDLNETLAVHAAWTEERFEAVDDRLVSLARIQVMTSGKIETQIAGIDAYVLGFGISQSGINPALARVEQKVEHLERGQDLAARVDDARRDDPRLDGSCGRGFGVCQFRGDGTARDRSGTARLRRLGVGRNPKPGTPCHLDLVNLVSVPPVVERAEPDDQV